MDDKPTSVSVRQIQLGDRDELIRMRMALWPDSEEKEVDQLLRRPRSEYALLVADRVKTGLRGFAELGLRPYAEGCRTSPVAYLEGIWIDEDARRSGVAARLVEEAVEWARSRGLAELASDCDLDNAVSRAFHLASGFDEVGRIICFRRDLTERGAE